ncbi:hypothetical protein [Halomonas sp. HG01]|uniref:hypothetical protein n=1 Tax=Halomonas sp. HG01 TaxID=1609967 RepID=UPI0006145191|nr:hypothetical protein [Halomonas sp. HG01]
MTVLQRLASLEQIGQSPVAQVLQDMGALGANQVAITVRDDSDTVLGGLVCLHGPNAQRYMQAIDAVTREIEAEEQDREQ